MISSARGTGEPQVNPTGYRNIIKGVMAKVQGGGNYEVKYPATTDYLQGPKIGAADANRYLGQQKTKCPGQKYLLLGYSEGVRTYLHDCFCFCCFFCKPISSHPAEIQYSFFPPLCLTLRPWSLSPQFKNRRSPRLR